MTRVLVIEDEPWRETMERIGNTPQKLVGLIYAPGGAQAPPGFVCPA